jgi:hypothetical protein
MWPVNQVDDSNFAISFFLSISGWPIFSIVAAYAGGFVFVRVAEDADYDDKYRP